MADELEVLGKRMASLMAEAEDARYLRELEAMMGRAPLEYIDEYMGFTIYVAFDGDRMLVGHVLKDDTVHYRLALIAVGEPRAGGPVGKMESTEWWDNWRYQDSSETCRAIEGRVDDIMTKTLATLKVHRRAWAKPAFSLPIRVGTEHFPLAQHCEQVLKNRRDEA